MVSASMATTEDVFEALSLAVANADIVIITAQSDSAHTMRLELREINGKISVVGRTAGSASGLQRWRRGRSEAD